MKRRRYLAGLGLGVLAGCLDDGAGQGTTTGGYRLAIESVATRSFSLRLNDLGDDVGPSSPSLEDLDADARAVVVAALDEGYETDEPAPWLRTFLDETPYVEVDGVHYSLEHTLPMHVVTAERVAPEDVGGDVASPEEYEEGVTLDGRVFTGFARIAAEEGYRTVDLHPDLRAFLEEYEAVEYRGETLRLAYQVEDPGAPYRVRAEQTADEDVYGGTVIDVEEMDADYRAPVREAAATAGVYGVDDPPEGLADVVEAHQYVRVDGAFYAAYASDSSGVTADVDATLVDGEATESSPAELALSVENTGTEPISIFSGAPGPFGIQRMHPQDDPDTRVLLWTDEYVENSHVHTDGRSIRSVNAIGISTDVDPGDTASQTFEAYAADVSTGTYELDDDVGLRDENHDGSRTYTVTITVERAQG